MLATVDVINAWLQLLIGFALLLLAPIAYKFEPNLYEHVRNFWGSKSLSTAHRTFQRTGATLFFVIVGLLVVVGSLIRLA